MGRADGLESTSRRDARHRRASEPYARGHEEGPADLDAQSGRPRVCDGAGDRNRTCTKSPSLEPKSSASTSSATPACQAKESYPIWRKVGARDAWAGEHGTHVETWVTCA